MNVGSILSRLLKNTGDDVANKIGQQYSAANISKLASSSADDIAAKQGNLIATHQITSDKLSSAADLGGFVQPSMAVVDPSKAINFLPGSDFGDIVMVANRNAIDPKRAASKTFIGDRDIYSPRFPRESYDINMNVLDDLAKQSGDSRQFALSNLRIDDDPKYSDFMQRLYRKNNPQVADMSTLEMRDTPEFTSFANDAFNQLRGDKHYEYFTKRGALKTLPATANNASKIMNKSAVVGGERASNILLPSDAYYRNTKQLRSLDDLYKNRYRLTDSVTGESTKEAMTEELSNISSEIYKVNPDNADIDAFDYVIDSVAGNKQYQNPIITDDIAKRLEDLRVAYKDVPVSYFEAKPRRVVGGDDWYGAYIPDNSSPEVIEQLNRLGVQNIKKYLDDSDLDLQLAALAKEGKRGVNPYVLSMAGALPTAGILSSLLGGQNGEQQYV